MSVRDQIVARRRQRLLTDGPFQGLSRPLARAQPLVSFCQRDAMIFEIKRASPSKGDINPGLSAADQVMAYSAGGARNISVLTEQDYFKGSLVDLMEAKAANPSLAYLRKDFLLDRQDVEASYLCGADAILIIASLFDTRGLGQMLDAAREFGLTALVELHDADDLAKARPYKPALCGINSRDLASLAIDPLLPIRLKASVDWDCRLIYESGILSTCDAAFASSCGFSGILVGESVSRNPTSLSAIRDAFLSAPARGFWPRLYSGPGRGRPGPMVKICGLCRAEDVAAAEALGADALGFVFADSPRRVDPGFLRALGRSKTPRVGVFTGSPEQLSGEILELMDGGFLDAIQFHGDMEAEGFASSLQESEFGRRGFAFYKAIRLNPEQGDAKAFLGSKESAMGLSSQPFLSPRILFDSYQPALAGGSGKLIDERGLVGLDLEGRALWLAGGLDPGNLGRMAKKYRPELVDASSRLESAYGKKDAEAMRRFVEVARHAEYRI